MQTVQSTKCPAQTTAVSSLPRIDFEVCDIFHAFLFVINWLEPVPFTQATVSAQSVVFVSSHKNIEEVVVGVRRRGKGKMCV